jgi:Cu/Zn superoxide dismutase
MTSSTHGRRAAASIALACTVGLAVLASACTSWPTSLRPAKASPDATKPDAGPLATLRSVGGSALSGKIRVIDSGDGASVLVSLINVPSGAYRIAFHETPNCTSPNGFSAGKPWAPASVGKRAQDLIPTQYANTEAIVESELRIAGLRASGPDGVAGRSVMLYAGTSVVDVRPDVPNAAIACGVFQPAQPLMF